MRVRSFIPVVLALLVIDGLDYSQGESDVWSSILCHGETASSVSRLPDSQRAS